jgi:uncharacterized membrane protein
MAETTGSPKSGVGRKLRRYFITGFLVSIPLGVTIFILVWIFNTVDNLLEPLTIHIWGHYVPGIGFGVTVVLIFLVGIIASNLMGRRLIRYGESIIGRVPIFREIYSAIKHIVDSFSAPNKTSFLQVVLVEFPRKGMRTIGFVTNEVTDKSGKKTLNVLIPNSPNPMSGFLEIVNEEQVVRTKVSVDQALQMIVSAGRMMPNEVSERLPAGSAG